MDEERRLLQVLARREKVAWAELYDRHVRDLYGFVYHLAGGDAALAEEIHQDVWLAALEGIERFDVRTGRFHDWLMGIRDIASRGISGPRPGSRMPRYAAGTLAGSSSSCPLPSSSRTSSAPT